MIKADDWDHEWNTRIRKSLELEDQRHGDLDSEIERRGEAVRTREIGTHKKHRKTDRNEAEVDREREKFTKRKIKIKTIHKERKRERETERDRQTETERDREGETERDP